MEEIDTLKDMNKFKSTKIASLKRKLKRETDRRKRIAAGDDLDLSSGKDEDHITDGGSDAGSSTTTTASAKTGLKKARGKKGVSWKDQDE